MKRIDSMGEVISTDVLVIGGSIAGIPAAIKAKEKVDSVLVVDKCGIGWGGQVPITGGFCVMVDPEAVDQFTQWRVETGEYLNNQEWTDVFARGFYPTLTEMFREWDLPAYKKNGELVIIRAHSDFAGFQYQPSKLMIKLKQVALARGVKTLDKIYISDLLQDDDGTVVGALGYGLVDGKTYIFKAKATLIACGGTQAQCNRRFTVNWGDGQLMAYRAGAQLMNTETSVLSQPHNFRLGDIYRRGPYYVFFENALGERFMDRYYPELMGALEMGGEKQDFNKVADSMLREVEAGRGPIYLDFRKLTPEEMEVALRRQKVAPPEFQAAGGRGDLLGYILKHTGHDPLKEKLEMVAQIVHFGGNIRVDLDCQSTVEGLWAAGDASMHGSGESGAKPAQFAPGFGISWAAVSGFRAGRSAGEYAASKGKVKAADVGVKDAIKSMLQPLNKTGTLGSREVVYQVQEVILPLKGTMRWEEGFLKKAIRKLDKVQESLDRVGARDHHELSRYHQAAGLLFSSKVMLKAALMRKESRGSFRRVDYPDRDDKNWLKWIVAEQRGERDRLFTEPVPIEKYPLKPPSKQ